MSKSLGNLPLVSNLLKTYPADVIRLVLQRHHYRQPWECFPADLQAASTIVDHFAQVRALVGRDASGEAGELTTRFQEAMENDLDSLTAINLLDEAAQTVIAQQDLKLGSELLLLTGALGLRV